ncbi:MAG: hypothetical protein ABI417_02790 [Coleofasciculaceae cyanobacterium]
MAVAAGGNIAIAFKLLNVIKKSLRQPMPLFLLALASVCLFLGTDVKSNLIGTQPATAQIFSAPDAWRKVYQLLPSFPKENQYVSRETGKVDENSTLASRLIRYHVFVKNRPPGYRMDWKLTLADYLGVNQYLVESQYPGSTTLRTNPMESDRAAINKLTRKQRNDLVNVLASIFDTNPPKEAPATKPVTTPPPAKPVTPNNTRPKLPQPGAAELLR